MPIWNYLVKNVYASFGEVSGLELKGELICTKSVDSICGSSEGCCSSEDVRAGLNDVFWGDIIGGQFETDW